MSFIKNHDTVVVGGGAIHRSRIVICTTDRQTDLRSEVAPPTKNGSKHTYLVS